MHKFKSFLESMRSIDSALVEQISSAYDTYMEGEATQQAVQGARAVLDDKTPNPADMAMGGDAIAPTAPQAAPAAPAEPVALDEQPLDDVTGGIPPIEEMPTDGGVQPIEPSAAIPASENEFPLDFDMPDVADEDEEDGDEDPLEGLLKMQKDQLYQQTKTLIDKVKASNDPDIDEKLQQIIQFSTGLLNNYNAAAERNFKEYLERMSGLVSDKAKK